MLGYKGIARVKGKSSGEIVSHISIIPFTLQMNKVMQMLTIIATIFIPVTFIAGVYGMNFANIPETQWEHGYLFFWILIVIVALLLIRYFRKKRWL